MGRQQDTRLAILLTFIFGFEVTSSQFMNFYGNKLTIAPDNSIVCNSDLECIEDNCNEGRVCRRLGAQFVQYGIMTCDENSETPYCDKGLCSKTPRMGCEPIPFICPTDGVFPDPMNCSRYHKCANGVATTNQCPSKNVYDHLTGGCKYQKKAANCVSFNCAGREGQHVVYSQDQRIYGMCLFGTALILGRCKDHEIYDIDKEECVRNCKAGGVQPADPGPNSCRKYVLCAEVSPKKYEPVEMSCACNEGYDEEKNGCSVNATCLANIIGPLCPKADDSSENGNDANGENDETGKDSSIETATSNENNSGNLEGDNTAADNNDDDNSENGNDNEKESDADSAAPADNNNDGNGSNNDDDPNSENSDSTQPSLIVDNSEGDDNDNDDHDGNLVNESDNGGDSNSGEIHSEPPPVINTPEDNDNVKNDDVEEDSTNGNDDGDNSNSDANSDSNVSDAENSNDNANANGDKDANDGDSVNDNNDDNQESGNGKIDDSDDNENNNDNDVNDNVDQNDSGNVNSDKPETTTEEPKPSPKLVESFIRVIIDWIMRIIVGQLQSPSS